MPVMASSVRVTGNLASKLKSEFFLLIGLAVTVDQDLVIRLQAARPGVQMDSGSHAAKPSLDLKFS